MRKGLNFIGVGIGAAILNKEGKIFLHKRGKNAKNEAGKWGCPGGTLKFGEKLEDAIKREMKEEFGINITPIDTLGAFNHLIPKEKQHWVALCFICKIKKGIPKILEPDKCDQIGWFTLAEMAKMDLTIVGRERLRQLKEKYLT